MDINLLTRKETMKFLGLSHVTLKKLIDEGKIKAYKLSERKYYFKRDELNDLFNQHITNGHSEKKHS